MKVHEYNEMMAYMLRPRQKFANGGRIGFGPGGQAFREKKIQESIKEFGLEALDEGAKKLGYNNYRETVGTSDGNKIKIHLRKYGRVVSKDEAILLGRKEKTATDRAATPTKGARIVKGNYTRDYSTSELIELSQKGLYDPYKNGGTFAEGVPEKKLVEDRIVDIEFSDPETKKNFFKDFEKRFKYLRGSKQLKKLEIDNAGLYKKYLSNLEPKTAELALAGLRNSLIEKTIASGGDASKYYYRTMGIDEKGKSNIVRKERLDKARKKAGIGVADILDAQDETVETLNKFYKEFPEELLGNTKLRNILDLTLEDGEIVKKNKYVTDEDFLKLIKERPLFTKDHIDEVQFEKLSTEFPVFRQLATYNTNSGLIRSIKSYVSKNQNSKDPVVQNKIKKQIEFLEDLKLRIDTPTGRVGSKEVLAAVDRKAGTLPNFLAQLRALNIKLPSKAKAVLLGVGGGLAATTLATAGPIEETGTTGFTTGEKLLAGTTAGAAVAARKPLLKTAAKVARPFGFPTVAGGFATSQFVNINPFSEEFGSLKDDPSFALAGADLLLPELTKQVGIRSLLANPFGRLARGFTPLGIGLQGVELINQARKEQDRINLMRETDSEAYQEYLAEQEDFLGESA